MNTATKRPIRYTDHRARSPKRRRLDGTDREPKDGENAQKSTTSAKQSDTGGLYLAEDHTLWAVRAILNERGIGRNRQYLVDWEGTDPKSGRSYPPSWEPPINITKDLVKDWKDKKKHETSSHLPPLRRISPNGIETGGLVRRPKRSRRILEDSSSETVEVSPQQRGSHTPALDSDNASTPAEDFGPDSPSLEILESQHQSSGPAEFSLQIPTKDIDKSEYETYNSSQVSYSTKSPTSTATALISSPLIRGSNQLLQAVHQRLLGAVSSSFVLSSALSPRPVERGVQIPASSETNHTLRTTDYNHNPQIIESSITSPRRDATSSQLLSSAQVLLEPPLSQKSSDSKALQPLSQSQSDSLASSLPWKFQSQFVVPRVTQMDAASRRQSPRLRASTPVKGGQSPRLAPREQTRRARTPLESDELNVSQEPRLLGSAPSLSIQDYSAEPQDSRMKATTPSPSSASAQAYAQESSMPLDTSPQQQIYESAFGTSALPIQQSIEEEPSSSAEEASIASKASSSQASLENERRVPQVDGISLPLQPVLAAAEYTIALPAEGKIQSAYADTIKAKRKTILKFINRRDSVGSACGSTNRTTERNEMIELIERLHDTTTHFDLALPGFSTQYSVHSQEHVAFAQYAGAKFVFLGCLVEALLNVDCSVVIASKPGPVQQLIEEFLTVKHVHVIRHDRPTSARSTTPDYHQKTLKIDLVDTMSDIDIRVSSRPVLLIAFDASFDNQSPQIRRIRELNSRGRNQLLPVVHLLTSNSSEHVDRCLRKAMPSPQRLKLLVRGTYQAKANLGGSPTYVPDPSDEPEGGRMDLHDLQRAVRKSPNRKLNMMAHIVARAAVTEDFEQYWSLGAMPEIQYEELEDTPPKLSERSTAAGTASATPRNGRARSRTPLSRVGTPFGKKRLLDPEDISFKSVLSKRQRMSPLRDVTPLLEAPVPQVNEVDLLRGQLKSLSAELASEKEARSNAQADLEHEKARSADWEKSHNTIMQRYDMRRIKQHTLDKENKRLQALAESSKEKQEKITQSNISLKELIAQLKIELNTAREELKASTIPDIAALEIARSEARNATAKAMSLEKKLENKNQDFEFTRQQYQQASTRAAELGQQNTELEAQVEVLRNQASDERRRLREINLANARKLDKEYIDQLEQAKLDLEKEFRKVKDENEVLKKGRGVQTRGSSVQPPGSPSVAGVGTRSRQGSPAPHVMSSAADARRDLHQGHAHANNRVSGLRNER